MAEYLKLIHNTQGLLGATVPNFEVHCPMLMNETTLKQAVSLAGDWPAWGYGIKTLYAMYETKTETWVACDDVNFKSTYMPEVYHKLLKDRAWFSFGDEAQPGIGMYLEEMFPNKSKYE